MTDRFYPCQQIPWRALPIGGKALCYAAGVLLAVLTWWEGRRSCR